MHDKVKIDVKKGKGTITEGGDTFLGKLLAKKGKVRIRRQGRTTEVNLAAKPARKAKVVKPEKK